jgi:hypothetical protein
MLKRSTFNVQPSGPLLGSSVPCDVHLHSVMLHHQQIPLVQFSKYSPRRIPWHMSNMLAGLHQPPDFGWLKYSIQVD